MLGPCGFGAVLRSTGRHLGFRSAQACFGSKSRSSIEPPPDRTTTCGRAGTYPANVCAYGALQGDWYLAEPGGPFFPLDDVGIAAVDVDWLEAPIEARAGASMSSWTEALIAR